MHKHISEGAALLAVALLNLADDDGRFEADPQHIQSLLFSRRPLSCGVDQGLRELSGKTDWLVLYDAKLDGHPARIGQIVNFGRHQVINKYKPSQLPAPPRGLIREDYGSTTEPLPPHTPERSETGDSSTTEPLRPSLEGRKEGKERNEGRSNPPPTLDEVLKFCAEKKIPEEAGRGFFHHFEKTVLPAWRDKNGKAFQWPGRLETWAETEWPDKKNAAGKTGGDKTREQLEAEMLAERDPARRKDLKDQLKKNNQ